MKYFGTNVPRLNFYQECLNYTDPLKTIAARERDLFSLCINNGENLFFKIFFSNISGPI